MTNCIQTQIEIEGVEVEAQIEFDYSPGRPAALFALPENCTPEEFEEYNVTKLELFNSDGEWEDHSELIKFIHEQMIERIQAWQVDNQDEG